MQKCKCDAKIKCKDPLQIAEMQTYNEIDKCKCINMQCIKGNAMQCIK